MWKLPFFSESEAFGCSLDAEGGAGQEVCSGRDRRDSWTAWRIMKCTRTRTVGPRTQHGPDRKSKPLLTRKIFKIHSKISTGLYRMWASKSCYRPVYVALQTWKSTCCVQVVYTDLCSTDTIQVWYRSVIRVGNRCVIVRTVYKLYIHVCTEM